MCICMDEMQDVSHNLTKLVESPLLCFSSTLLQPATPDSHTPGAR